MDAVGLLRHRVDPAALITAGKPGAGAPAGHLVQYRDVLGDPDRVCRRQNDAELADPDAFCLHREIQIEQHRVVRDLETFDVEVMLGKADQVVTEIVGEPYLRRDFAQHPLVKLGPHASEPRFYFGAVAEGRKIEQRRLHACLRICAAIAGAGLIIAKRRSRV